MKLKSIILLIFIPLVLMSCAKRTKVTKVIDGVTIITNMGDVIRIIGIDAPELDQHSEKFFNDVKIWHTTPNDEFSNANASKRALEDKILNKRITLKTCPYFKHEKPHLYRVGRKLRYVYLGNEDISGFMLSMGHARVWDFTFSPDVYFHKKNEEFRQLQNYAKKTNSGVWKNSVSVEKETN